MKKIGLVGGIGPASTIEYYRELIRLYQSEIQQDRYPEIVIDSVNMTKHNQVIAQKNYDLLAEYIIAGGCPITPNDEDQKEIGKLIYPNLENGIVILEDKKRMLSIIEKYYKHFGIDAVLLGCTELPIMIQASDLKVSVINTTRLHIRKILAQSLL